MKDLTNEVRRYAWGSRTVLAELQGRPVPSESPEAELWLGAHPAAPSRVPGGATLTEMIAADPVAALGAPVAAQFDGRLPFLLKVLAAGEPLSLQVHPDAAQARAGFAAEAAAGVDAAQRNYADPYHKPELLVALDDFEALCGFRDPDRSADDLARLGVAALAPVVSALRSGAVADRLRSAVPAILDLSDDVVREAVTAAESSVEPAHRLVADLGRRYPGDPGVVLAQLLNHVVLRPGDAVFMPAGNLHAYLHGAGVEIMADSDNVLRAGLTPKRVDVPELLRILRYEVLVDPVVRPRSLGSGLVTWTAPVDEFVLVRAHVTGSTELPGAGPRIVVCLRGEVRLRTDAGASVLAQGQSVFIAAAEGPVAAAADDALVFQASTSLAD